MGNRFSQPGNRLTSRRPADRDANRCPLTRCPLKLGPTCASSRQPITQAPTGTKQLDESHSHPRPDPKTCSRLHREPASLERPVRKQPPRPCGGSRPRDASRRGFPCSRSARTHRARPNSAADLSPFPTTRMRSRARHVVDAATRRRHAPAPSCRDRSIGNRLVASRRCQRSNRGPRDDARERVPREQCPRDRYPTAVLGPNRDDPVTHGGPDLLGRLSNQVGSLGDRQQSQHGLDDDRMPFRHQVPDDVECLGEGRAEFGSALSVP